MVEGHNESEATRKQFATFQARAALAGWGRARTCSTLAEVEQLLDKVAPEVWLRAGGGG